jgi:hypothetical protein
MIFYNIDDKGIMHVVFEGNIGYKDILSWLSDFSSIPELPNKINLLYDLRGASLKLDMVKLIKVAKRTEEATMKFERVRTVFLIEENKLTSYNALLSFLNTKGKTTRKVFSDPMKALDWLMSE